MATTDGNAAMAERLADELLADVGEDFNLDEFWHLARYGEPQISGGREHQLARQFRDRISEID